MSRDKAQTRRPRGKTEKGTAGLAKVAKKALAGQAEVAAKAPAGRADDAGEGSASHADDAEKGPEGSTVFCISSKWARGRRTRTTEPKPQPAGHTADTEKGPADHAPVN